jgi:hypothetical protein
MSSGVQMREARGDWPELDECRHVLLVGAVDLRYRCQAVDVLVEEVGRPPLHQGFDVAQQPRMLGDDRREMFVEESSSLRFGEARKGVVAQEIQIPDEKALTRDELDDHGRGEDIVNEKVGKVGLLGKHTWDLGADHATLVNEKGHRMRLRRRGNEAEIADSDRQIGRVVGKRSTEPARPIERHFDSHDSYRHDPLAFNSGHPQHVFFGTSL